MRPSETGAWTVLLFFPQCLQLLGCYGRARHRGAVYARRLHGRRLCIRFSDSGAGAGVPRHPYGDEHGCQDEESRGASNGGLGHPAHTVAPLVPVGLSPVRGPGIRDCIRKAYIGMKGLGI